jgi:hypothetical protein
MAAMSSLRRNAKRDQPDPIRAGPDPRWDRKRGTPKDQKMARTVERASGRYSASEQSGEKRKRPGNR